ncbi:unnamed protein product [Paramecium pentaurelia]|uniref:Transmembrane protein n=1 Tax=Paramecium pentaurelia TaxID=43138 RepID=A0A8S1VHQ1_9CILI|nr:unnamed protein product [Paramecium pentaurelia]
MKMGSSSEQDSNPQPITLVQTWIIFIYWLIQILNYGFSQNYKFYLPSQQFQYEPIIFQITKIYIKNYMKKKQHYESNHSAFWLGCTPSLNQCNWLWVRVLFRNLSPFSFNQTKYIYIITLIENEPLY